MAKQVMSPSVFIPVAVSVASIGMTFIAAIKMSGRRQGIIETDIAYIKRDVANLMRYFKLTPAEDQNRRRRL